MFKVILFISNRVGLEFRVFFFYFVVILVEVVFYLKVVCFYFFGFGDIIECLVGGGGDSGLEWRGGCLILGFVFKFTMKV